MRSLVLLIMLGVPFLPVGSFAQEPECDGNFHMVHDIGVGELNDVDVAPSGEGWAVGHDFGADGEGLERPLAIRFDADSFERITPYEPSLAATLEAVHAVAPDDLFAVGYEYDADELPFGLILHWDGSSWTQMEAPTPGKFSFLRGVTAVAPDDVWAVGDWTRRGRQGETKTLLLHYDGTSWTKVQGPALGRRYVSLFDVDATDADSAWAVGFKGSALYPYVIRWNGIEWRHVRMPSLERRRGEMFLGVDAVSPDNVWVVGDGNERTLVVNRDEDGWELAEFPDVRGKDRLDGVAATTSHLWTVGYRTIRSFPRPLTASWENGTWDIASFEGGRHGAVEAVTIDGAGAAWAVGATSAGTGDPYDTTEVIERACTT